MECKKCGSQNLRKDGTQPTKKGRMQSYQCKDCGSYTLAPLNTEPEKSQSYTFNKVGITESELREKYDLKFKVMKCARELKPGIFLTESEFVKACNIVGGSYKNTIESSDLDRYRGKVPGSRLYSHPDSIDKMKREGIMT